MRPTTVYHCSNCDAQFPKWQGRCTECGQWGTLEHEVRATSTLRATKPGAVVSLENVSGQGLARLPTSLGELDRVLGGGLVAGSLTLLGGDPGIGKSTLLLQLASGLARRSPVLYVSGEESAEQVGLKLKRLKLPSQGIAFLAETNLDTVIATLESVRPQLAIIDSIQTLAAETLPAEAGSITQVRASTVRLLAVAKQSRISLIIVGHMTKEGAMAGPKSLEHLVDTVLYLEGDRHYAFRILRSTKNRFGSTNEVGVFDMHETGLREVRNPSEVFLSQRHAGPGSVVTSVIEGSRAFLIEVQALVNPTVFGLPRRTTAGFDFHRLQLLLAVLTKRCGLKLGTQDVFVNIVGGLKVTEPAADLAVALAIASAASGRSVARSLVAIGEVGLGGEIRAVTQLPRRLTEAKQLGFSEVVVAAHAQVDPVPGLNLLRLKTVREAISETFGRLAEPDHLE